jgi:hypothetical protein
MMLGMILATASTPGLAQQPAVQPPTATELVAHLSTCAQLAKKILDTHGGHGADWGDPVVNLRYDPATDHCYVEMTMVSPRDTNLEHFLEQLATTTVYTTLWDGQTQELLATTTISHNGRFGMIFADDPNYKHTLPSADDKGYGFDDANDYINRLMYESH